MGKDIEIGPSAKGWSSVTLTCRSDVFKVRLEFPESFKGVVYTRGNYGEESPCMSDPEGEMSLEMTLPNTVCNVIQVSWWEKSYSYTYVTDPSLVEYLLWVTLQSP